MNNRTSHRWIIRPDRGRVCGFCNANDPPAGKWCPPCPYPHSTDGRTIADQWKRHAAYLVVVLACLGVIRFILFRWE